MTNKEYNIIMRYFNDKKVSREELEKMLDFENLTMEAVAASEITKLLKESPEVETDSKRLIEEFIRFVRERSGSGEITWDEFISRLKELELEYSDFCIRVQRFSKPAYWEIFFNHFSTTDYEDGDVKLTFDQEYYEEAEREKGYEVLAGYDIDTDLESGNIVSQATDRWNALSDDERDSLISALDAIYATHYVDKSRVSINKNEIKKITMSGADLVPEVGLRDYILKLTDGSYIELRF